jgi:hypothetical protein
MFPLPFGGPSLSASLVRPVAPGSPAGAPP